jgi:hypothetical protein
MVGLIAKVLFACLLVVAGILTALNQTGLATWGTISFKQPAVEPCERYATRLPNEPVLIEVRWAWVVDEYGWGCYFEFGDDSKATVTPMPK